MAENRFMGAYPAIGIRPTIDGRRGALKVRAPISYDGLEEKVAQIRLYSGEKCETVP